MGVINGLKVLMNLEKKRIESMIQKRVNIQDMKANLAEHCEVSQHNIEQIYKGYSLPSLEVALKIAQYYKVNVEQVFSLGVEEGSE